MRRLTKKEAKRIANRWLRERPVKEYGNQTDHHLPWDKIPGIGWWVYVTSEGRIVHMEPFEGES